MSIEAKVGGKHAPIPCHLFDSLGHTDVSSTCADIEMEDKDDKTTPSFDLVSSIEGPDNDEA